jgi:hypothetical protein
LRFTLWRAGLADKVTVIAAPSTRIAEFFDLSAVGFVFIDGSHDAPNPADDYLAFGSPLAPGSVLAFHDCPIPAIGEACAMAEADGFKQVDAVGSLRVFAR